MSARTERSFARGLAWFAGAAIVLAGVTGPVILPLQHRVREKAQQVSAKRAALAISRRDVQLVRELEPEGAEARGKLNALISNLGPDPAITLPKMIKEHFGHAGFDAAVEDLKTANEIPGLPGYVRLGLRVQVALRDEGDRVPVLVEAAAALEQRSPLIRVTKFALQPASTGGLERQASIDLSVLVRK